MKSTIEKQLPEGWIFCKLPDVCEVIMGQSPPGKTYNKEGKGLPFFQGKTEFGDKFPTVRKWCTVPQKIAFPGDILMSIRAPVGPTNVANQECVIGRGLVAFRPLGNIPTDYLISWIRLNEASIAAKGTGTTFMAISRSHISEIPVRLAPLSEQKRISSKVEKLLDRANKVKSRLDKFPSILKRFRQSIFSAAITGKLTEEWRKHESMSHWANTTVKNIASKIQYGYTASTNHKVKGPRFLRITDIQGGKVNWSTVPSCEIEIEKIEKYKLEKGDIVFARTGATTGKSFLIYKCPLAVFASYLIRVKPDSQKVVPNYLYLFFHSDSYWEQIAGKLSGSVQPNCNATKLSKLQLTLPPLDEQQEIVRYTKSLFALADKIEAHYKNAFEKVEKIIPSILAKAFRGELVQTEAEIARIENRTFETAKQLLKRIKIEREEQKYHSRKKGTQMHGNVTITPVLTAEAKMARIRSILEIISDSKKGISPEELLKASKYSIDTIEEFYEELALLEKEGKVEEHRPNNIASLLKAKK